MAAAVHNDIEYVKVKLRSSGDRHLDEYVILAKGRVIQLGDIDYEVVAEMKGSELVGRSYQPLFDYIRNAYGDAETIEMYQNRPDKRVTLLFNNAVFKNAWNIFHADYVEIGTEGTGAVHIAPAYGDDDLKLAEKNNLPIIHHVDNTGHFVKAVEDFADRLVKPKDDELSGVDHKDTDIEILKALQAAGKIFKKENITHSYPHCWRCDTPLLNYATTSWFVNVPKIKNQLVENNNRVKWVPEHVGTSRFGKWLEGARDWAVSRQRYWGAPLPIWKNPMTGEYKVFGSLADLQLFLPKRNNQYVVVRHAEAKSNVSGVINATRNEDNLLTEVGRTQCVEIAANLKTASITKIIHSGLKRAQETAELIAAELGLSSDCIIEDARIIEFQVGPAYEGKTWDEFNAHYASEEEKFTKQLPGVENRRNLIKRVGAFLYEYDAHHASENTLIIGHGSSIFALQCVAEGANMERTIELKKAGYFKNAEVRSLPFTPIPHNDFYELDYHRPYIDEIELYDEDRTKLMRVPDVFDCWFESGSMPYAQHHFMGEGKETFEATHFPAQFIAEGLDQTRGWFYSLIVLGTALFGKSPYQNVIVNGLVLAEDGKKMSKSLKNYPDPMELADRVGADAMRYYLLTSPLMRSEDLNFSEKEVLELQRKNIGRLHNVLAMYEMYADGTVGKNDSDNVLDRWIISRLNQLIAESTAGYQAYELDKATRPIADFIDDVSVWYLRRSRERLKSDDLVDKTLTLSTLRFILLQLSKVMAPAMPFYAEYLYRAVRDEHEPESVHLTAWPQSAKVDSVVLGEMSIVRELVTLALEARTKAHSKVRQPLQTLYVNTKFEKEYADIVLDEVNVKQMTTDTTMIERMRLDTTLTPELLAEGAVREIMRAVQDMRKEAGLQPADPITLTVESDISGQTAIQTHRELLVRTINATDLHFAPTTGLMVRTGNYSFVLSLSIT
jgi:isoleucyl-tRNA synthetase